jgi:hypothetical protein
MTMWINPDVANFSGDNNVPARDAQTPDQQRPSRQAVRRRKLREELESQFATAKQA